MVRAWVPAGLMSPCGPADRKNLRSYCKLLRSTDDRVCQAPAKGTTGLDSVPILSLVNAVCSLWPDRFVARVLAESVWEGSRFSITRFCDGRPFTTRRVAIADRDLPMPKTAAVLLAPK